MVTTAPLISVSRNCCATYMSGTDVHEKFEDKKGLIRSRKSKDRQHNGQK